MNIAFRQTKQICRATLWPKLISRTIYVVETVALLASGIAAQSGQAQTFSVLHEFAGAPDGASPTARLISGPSGQFFGTTYNGGANGFGAVFVLDSTGNETVLHSFDGSIAAYP